MFRRRSAVAHLGVHGVGGGDLITFLRDNGGDSASAQHPSSGPAGVGTVSDHGIGTRTWVPAVTRHDDLIEHAFQHRLVVALPAGDHHRQWAAIAIDGGMNLGGQPTAGASDAMTCRFTLV